MHDAVVNHHRELMERLNWLDRVLFNSDGLGLHGRLRLRLSDARDGSLRRGRSSGCIAGTAKVAQVASKARSAAGQAAELPARLLGLHDVLIWRGIAEHVWAFG